MKATPPLGPLGPLYLPSLARARELSKRTVCMAQLQAIGNACHIYANEHDGRFPADLDVLIREGAIAEGNLRCPSAARNVRAYILIPAVPNDSNVRNVLAYESPDNHAGEGVSVLFADGRAEWMAIDAFELAVAATKKRLQEAKQK